MARSTAAQSTQIGAEPINARGTAVPATKRLGSLGIPLSPEVESNARRMRGNKYPTVVEVNKEWATGDLEGSPTYDELVYPLSSILTQATTTQVMNGGTPTAAYVHTFEPASTAGDEPRTFTVEQGDTTHAERSSHVLFTDFTLTFSRDEVGISGSAFGTALERGITLTANPTPVATDLVPVLPGQVCLYVSDDVATLGDEGTHLPTGLSVEYSVGSRFNPVWYLNCREDSFSGFVETPEPDATANLTTEANAGGIAWADTFRTGATRFLRIEATGPQITAGVQASAYRLTIDVAVKVLNPGAYSDEDGVYAIQPELQIVHDPAWGRAHRVTLVNTVAAL